MHQCSRRILAAAATQHPSTSRRSRVLAPTVDRSSFALRHAEAARGGASNSRRANSKSNDAPRHSAGGRDKSALADANSNSINTNADVKAPQEEPHAANVSSREYAVVEEDTTPLPPLIAARSPSRRAVMRSQAYLETLVADLVALQRGLLLPRNGNSTTIPNSKSSIAVAGTFTSSSASTVHGGGDRRFAFLSEADSAAPLSIEAYAVLRSRSPLALARCPHSHPQSPSRLPSFTMPNSRSGNGRRESETPPDGGVEPPQCQSALLAPIRSAVAAAVAIATAPPSSRTVRQLSRLPHAAVAAAFAEVHSTNPQSLALLKTFLLQLPPPPPQPPVGTSSASSASSSATSAPHARGQPPKKRGAPLAASGLQNAPPSAVVHVEEHPADVSPQPFAPSSGADRLLALLYEQSAAALRTVDDGARSATAKNSKNSAADKDNVSEAAVDEEDDLDEVEAADEAEGGESSSSASSATAKALVPFFLEDPLESAAYDRRPFLRAAVARHFAALGEWQPALAALVKGRGEDSAEEGGYLGTPPSAAADAISLSSSAAANRRDGAPLRRAKINLSNGEKGLMLLAVFVAKANLSTTSAQQFRQLLDAVSTAERAIIIAATNEKTESAENSVQRANLSAHGKHTNTRASAATMTKMKEASDLASLVAAFLSSSKAHVMPALELKAVLAATGCPNATARKFLTASKKQRCSVAATIAAVRGRQAASGGLSQIALDLLTVLLFRFARATHRSSQFAAEDFAAVAGALGRLLGNNGVEAEAKAGYAAGSPLLLAEPFSSSPLPLSPNGIALVAEDVRAAVEGLRSEASTTLSAAEEADHCSAKLLRVLYAFTAAHCASSSASLSSDAFAFIASHALRHASAVEKAVDEGCEEGRGLRTASAIRREVAAMAVERRSASIAFEATRAQLLAPAERASVDSPLLVAAFELFAEDAGACQLEEYLPSRRPSDDALRVPSRGSSRSASALWEALSMVLKPLTTHRSPSNDSNAVANPNSPPRPLLVIDTLPPTLLSGAVVPLIEHLCGLEGIADEAAALIGRDGEEEMEGSIVSQSSNKSTVVVAPLITQLADLSVALKAASANTSCTAEDGNGVRATCGLVASVVDCLVPLLLRPLLGGDGKSPSASSGPSSRREECLAQLAPSLAALRASSPALHDTLAPIALLAVTRTRHPLGHCGYGRSGANGDAASSSTAVDLPLPLGLHLLRLCLAAPRCHEALTRPLSPPLRGSKAPTNALVAIAGHKLVAAHLALGAWAEGLRCYRMLMGGCDADTGAQTQHQQQPSPSSSDPSVLPAPVPAASSEATSTSCMKVMESEPLRQWRHRARHTIAWQSAAAVEALTSRHLQQTRLAALYGKVSMALALAQRERGGEDKKGSKERDIPLMTMMRSGEGKGKGSWAPAVLEAFREATATPEARAAVVATLREGLFVGSGGGGEEGMDSDQTLLGGLSETILSAMRHCGVDADEIAALASELRVASSAEDTTSNTSASDAISNSSVGVSKDAGAEPSPSASTQSNPPPTVPPPIHHHTYGSRGSWEAPSRRPPPPPPQPSPAALTATSAPYEASFKALATAAPEQSLDAYARLLREESRPSMATLAAATEACAAQARRCWAQSLALLRQAALSSRKQQPPAAMIATTLKTLIEAGQWEEAAALCQKVNRASRDASPLSSSNPHSRHHSSSGVEEHLSSTVTLREAVGLSLARSYAGSASERQAAVLLMADVTMKCLVLARCWDAAVHHFYKLIVDGVSVSVAATSSEAAGGRQRGDFNAASYQQQHHRGGGGGRAGFALRRRYVHPSPATVEAALEACAHASAAAQQSAATVRCFAGSIEDLVCVGAALLQHVIRVVGEASYATSSSSNAFGGNWGDVGGWDEGVGGFATDNGGRLRAPFDVHRDVLLVANTSSSSPSSAMASGIGLHHHSLPSPRLGCDEGLWVPMDPERVLHASAVFGDETLRVAL